MHVTTLLAEKGTAVSTIRPDATLGDAVAQLARDGIGALVVSTGDGRVDGIISERDIVRELNVRGGSLLEQPVSSIMSTDVHTCSPEDDVVSIMTTMTAWRVRHMPVVSGGRLAGIVSIGDVVKSRIGELERDRFELMEYITAR